MTVATSKKTARTFSVCAAAAIGMLADLGGEASAYNDNFGGSWSAGTRQVVGREDFTIVPGWNSYVDTMRPTFPAPGSPNEPWTDRGYTRPFVAGGIWGRYMPGNVFFDQSEYGQDCSDGSLMVKPASVSYGQSEIRGVPGAATPIPQVNACKVTKAPVVDMAWIAANLDAGGYLYSISYPTKDFGNGHAIVTWLKACWVGPWPSAGYCYSGMARVEGAGWQNQFPRNAGSVPAQYVHSAGEPTYVPAFGFDHALGTPLADKMLQWPQGVRDTGFLFRTWEQMMGETKGTDRPTVTLMTDDWLGSAPTPPPLPPLPPIVAGAPAAGSINYGTPGSTGAGTGGSLAGDGRSVVTFDYAAFCNKPGSDGAPRSAGFVSACLAGAGK